MARSNPYQNFSYLMQETSRLGRKLADQALKPTGITRPQWWALTTISNYGEEGVMQTELARELETGKVSTGGLIDNLENAGLIKRVQDKNDRRVKKITITRKGTALLKKVYVIGRYLDTITYNNVEVEHLKVATEMVALMKENIKESLSPKKTD